jgi:hypothetical protein
VDGVIRKLNEGLLKEKYPDREVHLIAVHTPSFVGSMIRSYDMVVHDFVRHFATKTEPNGKLNLITGWVNPGNVKALKHLLVEMEIDATVLFEIESFRFAADARRFTDSVSETEKSWSRSSSTARINASFEEKCLYSVIFAVADSARMRSTIAKQSKNSGANAGDERLSDYACCSSNLPKPTQQGNRTRKRRKPTARFPLARNRASAVSQISCRLSFMRKLETRGRS